jgi:hypothetical protein
MLTLLLATLAFASTQPATCSGAEIPHAEAALYEAAREQRECFSPAECQVADEMVLAAREQKRAALAACSAPKAEPVAGSPFQPLPPAANPFAADDEPEAEDADLAAAAAVLGVSVDEVPDAMLRVMAQ